jgi:DNA-directed RNA polymerase
MEEIAGQPVWFAWSMDFRGRLYSTNRHATHQGPDHEKAAVVMANALPCDGEAVNWILKAAAGHWGLRSSWQERLDWGLGNVQRMLACADEPLNRVDLWRDAKDPWQFLSCCRALQQWRADPSQPVRQLIRLDQTTSGPGIIAALLRDKALARSCNLIGSTRHDLYEQIAAEVQRLVRIDLETGDAKEQRHAAGWLERGVTRKLAKGPCMTTVYGAQFLGLSEQLVALLDEAEGEVALDRLEEERLRPCRYLARKFQLVAAAKLGSALKLQAWLRGLSQSCLKTNRPLQWTSPMGWPIQVGRPVAARSRINTLLHGRRQWQTLLDQPQPGELSARETSRGITANLIHSFDAALAWQVVCGGAACGIDVLPNHDCFAVPPYYAGWLATTLPRLTRDLFGPEWLTEIGCGAALQRVPAPPMVGDLPPGLIGSNEYLFS